MALREFTVGRGYRFRYDASGLTALPDHTGTVRVIGAQLDLRGEVDGTEEWSAVKEATGNNAQISDGQELYAGAGFGDPLVEGQVDDVLWGLGDLADRSEGRLLELGCGPGFLVEALARRLPGWSMVGIDPSPTSVAQARSRGLDVREGFADTVDVEPGFDAVVVMGNFQLHHDQRGTLARLAELTRPGGAMFLDSKNPASSARRLAARAVASPAARLPGVHAFAAHALHGIRVAPTRSGLDELLADTGWTTMRSRTVGPRLLRYGNTHDLARGVKGRVWRALDDLDRRRGEQAWIQLGAVRAQD